MNPTTSEQVYKGKHQKRIWRRADLGANNPIIEVMQKGYILCCQTEANLNKNCEKKLVWIVKRMAAGSTRKCPGHSGAESCAAPLAPACGWPPNFLRRSGRLRPWPCRSAGQPDGSRALWSGKGHIFRGNIPIFVFLLLFWFTLMYYGYYGDFFNRGIRESGPKPL